MFLGQVFALVILLFLLIFRFPPSLQLSYQPDQLRALNGSAGGGFYPPETDPAGNRFAWTNPDTVIDAGLTAPKGVRLTLEARSAAVAGGPNAPVQVLVNGHPAGEIRLDPANQNFQQISLDVYGQNATGDPLKIELVAEPYKPNGDPRTLGFMVKSFQAENLGWPNTPFRLYLLVGLLAGLTVLTLVVGWRNARKPGQWAGYTLAGLNLLKTGLALAAVFLLGGFTSWLDSGKSYYLWTFGLGILALLSWQAAASRPFGQPRPLSLYRRVFRLINPRPRPKAAIPFKGVASIEALTGLRAIAAFIVFAYHYPLPADTWVPQWLYSIMRSGNIGVPLFFTLSGFVICYNYYDRLTTRPFKNMWPFLVNRFARIYPVYLLVFLIALVAVALTRPDRILPAVIWQQTFMLQSWNPDVRILSALIYNIPSWSVNVEIFLYLSFPLVAWLILRKCQRIGQLIAVAVVPMLLVLGLAAGFVLTGHVTANDYTVDTPGLYLFYYFPVMHLNEFISGCAAARIYVLLAARPVSQKELAWARVALGLAVAAVIFLMMFDKPYLIPFRFASAYIPFFTIIVFCLARYRTLLSRFFSTKLLILLGESSYSFYLWQEMFVVPNSERFLTIPQPLSFLFGFGVFLTILIVSIISFKLVETPMRKLIRRLALPSRPASPAQATRDTARVEANV